VRFFLTNGIRQRASRFSFSTILGEYVDPILLRKDFDITNSFNVGDKAILLRSKKKVFENL
jgi:hypothetical protein